MLVFLLLDLHFLNCAVQLSSFMIVKKGQGYVIVLMLLCSFQMSQDIGCKLSCQIWKEVGVAFFLVCNVEAVSQIYELVY